MNEFFKKLLTLIQEDETAIKSIDMKQFEAFLKTVKHKKLEYLNLKTFKLMESKDASGGLRLVAIASTDSVDRGDDVVLPEGILTPNIKNNMIPMLLQHEHGELIGGWDKWYINDENQFVVEGTFLPPQTELHKAAYEAVKAKMMYGISIGFYATKVSFDDDVRIIEELELIEVSVCTIPMNQDCNIIEVTELTTEGKNMKTKDKKEVEAKAPNDPAQSDEAAGKPPGEAPDGQTDETTDESEELTPEQELVKVKEENEALKARVAELEQTLADYEAEVEGVVADTEELMKHVQGVK